MILVLGVFGATNEQLGELVKLRNSRNIDPKDKRSMNDIIHHYDKDNSQANYGNNKANKLINKYKTRQYRK